MRASLSTLVITGVSALSLSVALSPTPAHAACYAPTPLELEAKVALHSGERNTARTKAEEALKLGGPLQPAREGLDEQGEGEGEGEKQTQSPRPVLGAFVLAQVYADAEGNFPKALYWLRRAERWLTEACGERPTEPDAQALHRDLILQQSYTLGDMDKRGRQLKELERYETIYQPPRDELKIWPLVKLGRFEEARAYGLELIKSDDKYVRSRAFNGLMAVECEARARKASYEWGMKGHIDAREQSCVIALNMGLASRQCFLFDEEERFNRLALNAQDRDCSSSPYIQSSASYLIKGEFQKSISALSSWAPRTASEWTQSHMRVKARRAELMYSLGVWGRGRDEAREVVTYPDRSAGTDSASEEMLNLEASLLYWAFLDGALVEAEERAAARGAWRNLRDLKPRAQLAFERWKQRRQVIRYASHDNLLTAIVRPYFSNVMPWYLSSLAHILGGGVLRGAISEARALERQDYPTEVNAYLDGLEAELCWVEGDEEETLRLAEQALKGVPPAAKLMRYRLMALRWGAKRTLNDPSLPAGGLDDDLHTLLSRFPTPLRILNLALPVRVNLKGGALAQEVGEAFAASPRFEVSPNASLSLEVSEGSEKLSVCLLGARGDRYGCAEAWLDLEVERAQRELRRQALKGRPHRVEREKGEAQDEQEAKGADDLEQSPVARVVDRVHATLLAPKVELTQKELDTLDGNIRQLSGEDALESLFP